MINFSRRQRQARENTEPLILAFLENMKNDTMLFDKKTVVKNVRDLDNLTKEIELNVISIARSISSDWALPIVIQIVGELYYGDYTKYNYCGNYFKRAAAYLWQNSFVSTGNYKNKASLVKLISQCYVLETLYSLRKMFFAIPDLYFSFENGRVKIPSQFSNLLRKYGRLASGRGKRMRIANINSKLMNSESIEFFDALCGVLIGTEPNSIEIFKDTFYENIPGIYSEECAKFWKELFFRYGTYLSALSRCNDDYPPTSVVLFHEFSIESTDLFLTQDIVTNSFWTRTWFDRQSPELYGNLLVHKPILRISHDGDFATSPVLIGDSINSFVEQQLLGYSNRNPYLNMPNHIFKDAFSEKFENDCIDRFRKHGYIAGHILDTGVWITQNGNIDLNFDDSTIYGEVDVFACHTELPIYFLVECKVLLDVQDSRSYQNIASKLIDDSEGFNRKLRKKCTWIKRSFNKRCNTDITPLMLLVTDIPMPILGTSDEEIGITDSFHLDQLICDIESLFLK